MNKANQTVLWHTCAASKEVVLENTDVLRPNRPDSAVLSCPDSVSSFGQDGANGNAARTASTSVFNILPTLRLKTQVDSKPRTRSRAMTQSAIALTLGNITIRQQNGLFSLNDLHKAAGGEAKHQPALFMRMDQTKALIEEISSSTKSQSLVFETVLGKGKAQGTYACRELVIAYAAWISAAFHLKVIRVFLAVAAPQATPYTVQPGDTLNEAQQIALRALLESNVKRLPQEKQAAAMVGGWSKLKAHFGVPYRQIPASEFTEALSIIARHVSQWELVDAPQQAQPAIDPLNAQAMAAASKQANEYFDAARQGKYLQQPTAFPSEVLCGLLAQAMLNQRFMLSFDRCTGRMNFKPVPDDAYVLSWQQFARAVVTNDIMATNTELAELASACNHRLAQRLAA